MSLNIYVEKAPVGLDVIRNVRAAFFEVRIQNTESTRRILQELEQSEFVSSFFVKDRFGAKLPIMNISEGCKAALCVEYFPDKVIDTVECGANAVSSIVKVYTKGSILIRHPLYLGIAFDKVDAVCMGHHFYRGEDLSYYLDNEYPYPVGTMDRRIKDD